jgi:hypothetical protein
MQWGLTSLAAAGVITVMPLDKVLAAEKKAKPKKKDVMLAKEDAGHKIIEAEHWVDREYYRAKVEIMYRYDTQSYVLRGMAYPRDERYPIKVYAVNVDIDRWNANKKELGERYKFRETIYRDIDHNLKTAWKKDQAASWKVPPHKWFNKNV